MIRLLLFAALALGIMSPSLYAQRGELESMFFSSPYYRLELKIKETSKLHGLYAYNIANLSTPGFKPVLPENDAKTLRELTISGRNGNEVMLEFLMARMADNAKSYTAAITIWKAKIDSLRRIVTLGK